MSNKRYNTDTTQESNKKPKINNNEKEQDVPAHINTPLYTENSSSSSDDDTESDTESEKTPTPTKNIDKFIENIFDDFAKNIFGEFVNFIHTNEIESKNNDNKITKNIPNEKITCNGCNCPNKIVSYINTCDCPSITSCNHKTFEQDNSQPPVINITNISNIDDLIILGRAFHCKKQIMYKGINLRILNMLVEPLMELNNMIGMKDVKKHVVNQILYFLQGFNTDTKCNKCIDCKYNIPCVRTNNDMLHTVITGPPGVGKTCLGLIIGKIYKAMGILSNGKFHEVKRSDFVAEYLGQTAIKTQRLINQCKGGIMFIDEAYSMGSKEKRDTFAKEALDTLNKNLSDNRDMLCIVAGYEKDLDECFFAMNEGLKRRFTFKYNIADYDYNELLEIFKLKLVQEKWYIEKNIETELINLFKTNKQYFPYFGGDIETFILHCKIAHSQRLPTEKKCITYNDIKNGFEQFTQNRKHNKSKSSGEFYRPTMYKF